VDRHDPDFDAHLLDWRQLESDAVEAEQDLRRIGNGTYDPRLRELQLLADQLRTCANAALRRMLDSVDDQARLH
jgi:hypothetical protein